MCTEYLDICDVNMLKQPNEENKQRHHTNLYANENLIVRRAQEFLIKITFDRPFKPEKDKFAVEFAIGVLLILKIQLVIIKLQMQEKRLRAPWSCQGY